METLKDLGSRLKRVSGDDEANIHLLQRFSIAIQRGNCGSVLGSTGALIDGIPDFITFYTSVLIYFS